MKTAIKITITMPLLLMAAALVLPAQPAVPQGTQQKPAQQAAPQPAERTFATPKEAAQALVAAASQNDMAALLKLFGPQGTDIVQSGDPAEDTSGRAAFARRAGEKMNVQMEPGNPNRATIVAGNDNWPFPVPLIRMKSGQWHFDAARGRTEILARRIGRNELLAIDICRGYVEAQMDYASHDYGHNGVLEYARKLVSTPGRQDGLYWEGQPGNLVPKDFADAADAIAAGPAGKRTPYHGYYFRILTAQGSEATGGAHSYIVQGRMMGGFALVAYPAEYGVSGIKTLIVNQNGIVYERDLGPATATLARQMLRFNPDKTWHAVQGE